MIITSLYANNDRKKPFEQNTGGGSKVFLQYCITGLCDRERYLRRLQLVINFEKIILCFRGIMN